MYILHQDNIHVCLQHLDHCVTVFKNYIVNNGKKELPIQIKLVLNINFFFFLNPPVSIGLVIKV